MKYGPTKTTNKNSENQTSILAYLFSFNLFWKTRKTLITN